MTMDIRKQTLVLLVLLGGIIAFVAIGIGTQPAEADLITSVYTLDEHFDQGTLVSVHHDEHNQLQLSDPLRPFPYIWIAASNNDTIVKVDTLTGDVLGEYRSAPATRTNSPSSCIGNFPPTLILPVCGGDPSRTTVDLDGNVWVGNRDERTFVNANAIAPGVPPDRERRGSVVKIGLVELGQCEERNNKPGIQTSGWNQDGWPGGIRLATGLGDIRDWDVDKTSGDDLGGVTTAEDECIIQYVRTAGVNARGLAVDENGDLWVGGIDNTTFEQIDGDTGVPMLNTRFKLNCGGYGALVDRKGVLWSATRFWDQSTPENQKLLRYVPGMGPTGQVDPCIPKGITGGERGYGLGIDTQGNIWTTHFGLGEISKIAPDGMVINTYSTGGSRPRGVAVTPEDDNVWVANSGSNTVSRLAPNGVLLATIPVGSTPTGVAVDSEGKVWVTDRDSDDARRIDPNREVSTGNAPCTACGYVDLTVNLGAGSRPYNYSDMTGAVSLNNTAPQGFWTLNHNSGAPDTAWGSISWNTENADPCPQSEEGREPPGSSITVEARVANTKAGFGAVSPVSVSNGVPVSLPNGQFLELKVTLKPAIGDDNKIGASPVLCDLTIKTGPPKTPKLPVDPPRVDETLAPGERIKIEKTVHVAESAELIVPQVVGCSPLAVSFEPPFAGPVEPPVDQVEFSETIAVPDDTPLGKIDCSVAFLADGVVIAVQKISITVDTKLPVDPPRVEAKLAPGESIKIDKTVHVPEGPVIVDQVVPHVGGCSPLGVSFEPPFAGPADPPAQVEFSETIAVPDDAQAGKINCSVLFLADGVVIGVQKISITVKGDDEPTPRPTLTRTATPTLTPSLEKRPVSPPRVEATLSIGNSIKVNKTVHVTEPDVPPGVAPVVGLVTATPAACSRALDVAFDPPSVGPLTQFPAQVEFSETITVNAPFGVFPSGKLSCTVEFRADGVLIGVQQISISIRALAVVGDVNGDGAVNSIDATLILQFDAGLIDSLP